MEVHGGGEGEVAALGERRDHQARETTQILVGVAESGTGLGEKASHLVAIPVVPKVPETSAQSKASRQK